MQKTIAQCFPNSVPRHTGAPWTICRCAANLFKVLYVDTNFLLKSRKCYHEEMVNNCCKSRVTLQITAREIMNFFVGDQHHFGLRQAISKDVCPGKW